MRKEPTTIRIQPLKPAAESPSMAVSEKVSITKGGMVAINAEMMLSSFGK
jgi:hypothetical protein